ncbi:MAG TPA: BatA and WFA domain-containing protein [Planctomycetota bacterium]|nr:BatA and WFA domain-containing protein [Planctomycetota bacterium]
MNFLEPWGLLGLLALIPVIALYFLKLKREHRTVPSTLLWKKVIDDMQVNSPFQRLKYSLLLLLQLLMIALLGFALARPYLNFSGSSGSKTILLVDTSASMGTRDEGPGKKLTRLEAAVRDAEQRIDDMRAQDEMLIVAFDRDVRQLSKFSSDRALLKSILADLKPADLPTRAGEAIETAISLCEGHRDVRVLVLSDGCFGNLKLMKEPEETIKGNIEDKGTQAAGGTPLERLARKLSNFRFVSYGADESDNVGITQIDARTRPVKAIGADGQRVDAVETQVFVMVENFSNDDRDVVLSLATSTQRFPPKVIHLKGRPTRAETLGGSVTSNTSEASRSVEVFRLPLGSSGVVTASIDGPKDRLAADNTAHCVIGASEGTKLLLVSKGNYFLEKALGAMKGVSVTTMVPEEFQKLWDQKAQQAVEPYDASIFEGMAPISWNEGGALFLGAMPPLPGYAKAEKPVEWPAVVDWDVSHATMRYVNFGNVTVAKAQAWTVPKTTRVLVEGTGGPLAVAAETDRLRTVGIAFDVFSSDWAYRPSLPLFLRNVVPWIAEASPRRHPTTQRTGEPLVIPPGLGAPVATLIRPGGGSEKIELSQERNTFVKGTDKAGLYTLKDTGGEDRIFAVNLAAREESDNARQGALKIGEVKIDSNRAAIEAKREIWRDLAIAAGVLLMLEWWVYHRRVGL